MKPTAESAQASAADAPIESPALNAAFQALKNYDAGSSRAALLPIDAAVIAGLADPAKRAALETRLVKALSGGLSVVASGYVCAKLAVLGGEASIPVLASLLGAAARSDAARNALQSIPGHKAVDALRTALGKLRGLQQIGVIHSLGWRRDAGSVRTLASLLKRDDVAVAAAALAALGGIGNARATRVLREYEPRCPAALRSQLGDACLVCAEHLRAAGQSAEAAALDEVVEHLDVVKQERKRAGRQSPIAR